MTKEGWGSAVGRLTDWLNPFIDPKQRNLREEAKLQKEQATLEAMPWSTDRAVRSAAIDRRLVELRAEFKNLTS